MERRRRSGGEGVEKERRRERRIEIDSRGR